MLPYARRIVFQPEFQLPTFSYETLYREVRRNDDLLNNKGEFFVDLSEKQPYLREIVKQAQDLGLTVSGDGTNPVKGGDITQATKNSIISFGSSTRFDVNWMRRDEYACKRGVTPVYDAVKDWNKIEKAMKQFADQKKATNFGGTNIRFHAKFMVVDGRIVPYEKHQVAVLIPVQALRELVCEYELITTVRPVYYRY